MLLALSTRGAVTQGPHDLIEVTAVRPCLVPRRTSLTATVPRTFRGRTPKTATAQAAPMASIGAPSLDIAGAPDDLFSLSVGGIACEERFSWNEVGARVRRAPWRARLRVTGAGCSRLLGVVELRRTRWTTQTHSRDRNLQRRGLLAQSRRRICFIPDDEGIVVPVCVADTLGGLEPGGAAQLPKAVVHFHNSGINAPLALVRCPGSPGNNRILRHSSSAATHRQQSAPERSPFHNRDCVLAKPSR